MPTTRNRMATEFTGPPTMADLFGAMRSEYQAGQRTKYSKVWSGLPSSGAGADHHYRSESQYLKLMEIGRHFLRDDPIVRPGIKRLTSNVMQEGFNPEADTGDDVLDQELNERWKEWASEPDLCDISARHDFATMESLAFESIITDGDILTVLMDSGHLRWFEAHRARTPRNTTRDVVHGFRLDNFRKPIEVWLTKEDLNPWESLDRVSDVNKVAMRDEGGNRKVLHCLFPDRFSQTRGITAIAPVVDTAGMFDDIQLAKLIQQKAVSAFALIRKRPIESLDDGTGSEDGETDLDEIAQQVDATFRQLGAGMMIDGLPGEDWQSFSSNIPNPEYFQHAMLILTVVAINLDLPLPVLLLDPQKSNFSSWRGAIDQARTRFIQMQSWLVTRFHRPVWQWKVRQWMREDRAIDRAGLKSNINVLRHKWHPPRWDYIEPLKDAQADSHQLQHFLNSPSRLQARRGRRFEDVASEMARDSGRLVRLFIAEAEAIKSEFPQIENPPTWQDLMQVYSGKIATSGGQPPPEDPEDPEGEDAKEPQSAAA